MKILVYGPHADEYSFAKVNRNLAIALAELASARPGSQQGTHPEIYIGARKSEVSRLPNRSDLTRYPELAKLAVEIPELSELASSDHGSAETDYDVVIYNNFPKDPSQAHGLANLPGRHKIAYLAWEENRFPEKWVTEYNQHLDMVFVASLHTKLILKRSGVNLPIYIVPNAPFPMDFADEEIAQAKVGENLRFLEPLIEEQSQGKKLLLHISSGLARKGVEELITAFAKLCGTEGHSATGVSATGHSDRLHLIIKSYPNQTNEFPDLLEQHPEIAEHISYVDSDFSDVEMLALLQSADLYLSPSRAEGFNLPVFEAMATGIPVVTTSWSGQMDFCTDYNSHLVDYQLKPAKSHLDNPGSYWAEVDPVDLAQKVHEALQQNEGDRQIMIDNARQTAQNYNWEASAKLALAKLGDLPAFAKTRESHLAVISTYNSICGIAEYSSYLYDTLESSFASLEYIANKDATGRVQVDGDNVRRLWEYGETDFSDTLEYLAGKHNNGQLDIVHIQYNLGFYTFAALEKLISGLSKIGVKVILTPHAVQQPGSELGEIKTTLKQCSQIQVLNTSDQKYLQELGLGNVHFFAHGGSEFPYLSKDKLKRWFGIAKDVPVIATHGFLVENKGVAETLAAVKELRKQIPNIQYLAINAVNPQNMGSKSMAEKFNSLVAELELQDNVTHIAEFLDREEIITLLGLADVLVFAYPEAKETASGAVRLGMAANRPAIVTKSSQFKDLHGICATIESNSPTEIAVACTELLSDKSQAAKILENIKGYTRKHSWDEMGAKYIALVAQI